MIECTTGETHWLSVRCVERPIGRRAAQIAAGHPRTSGPIGRVRRARDVSRYEVHRNDRSRRNGCIRAAPKIDFAVADVAQTAVIQHGHGINYRPTRVESAIWDTIVVRIDVSAECW